MSTSGSHYPPSQSTNSRPAKSRKTLWILLGVGGSLLLVCCIAGALASTGDNRDTPSASHATATAAKATTREPATRTSVAPTRPRTASATPKAVSGLNAPVRDGKFEFTVTAVTCGKTKVGGGFLDQTAQGQFCLVAVTVKNIGDQSQLFDASSQKAFNGTGQEYSADGAAGIYVNEGTKTFLNDINPGNTVAGTLVFDIPKGQELARLELHDSGFSGGVTVDL